MKTTFYAFYLLVTMVLLFSNQKAGAQTSSVGIGTITPDPSSLLDITSTTKGVLLPRMTMNERDAIPSPATGLLIYQWDVAPGFYFYRGGWQPLASSSGGGANLTLSNLQTTAINKDLLPGSSASNSLGSASLSWKDIYLFGDVYLQGNRFIGARATNSFFGIFAGNPSVTGDFNTATGYAALTSNIGGKWNTANGRDALLNTNNGNSNTGVGFESLVANTTGSLNSATGVSALSSNAIGTGNSAHGVSALFLSKGNFNSAIGFSAGSNLPAGDNNTLLGAFADAPEGTPLFNATAVGYQAIVTGSNSVRIGNTSVASIGGNVGWTNFSDGRFKRNVMENVPGLDFINQLRPVTYNLDVDDIDKTLRPPVAGTKKRPDALGNKKEVTAEEIKSKQEKASVIYTGFIAQEVEAAAKGLGYQFSGVDAPKNSKDFYGLRYAEFVVPLVKAVQELNKKLQDLQDKNSSIKSADSQNNIENTIVKQQAQIDRQQQEIDAMKAMLLQMQKQMDLLKSSAVK